MSENPVTKFDLVDANDMSPLFSLAEAYGRSFKPVFDGPGSFSFSLSLDADASYLVRNRATGVKIVRNELPIWSGGVTNIVRSASANTMQVTATGWLEEFDHRYVRKSEEATLTFSGGGATGGSIISTLISTCNGQLDTDGVARPLRVTFGGATDTQVRTRAYHVGDNYGASIRELIAIENGVDVIVDPISRKLSAVPPTSYTDRTNLHLGFGTAPYNLDDAIQTTDGFNVFNRENAVTASGIVASADDAEAIEQAGVMLEEWISLSDISDATIAAAYANAELVVKRYGLVTYQLTPKPYADVPRPYSDFQWGDKCYFSVDRGSFQVEKQAIRIFAGTINYTDDGDEVIAEYEVAFS
jgi:hypothetical protein